MQALNDRLHHEELNRVLLKVMRQAALSSAVETIFAAILVGRLIQTTGLRGGEVFCDAVAF